MNADKEEKKIILSIVTVVLNDLKGLQKTVASIKYCLVSEVEYWVIDGNSSDGTLDFLKDSQQRWIKFTSEPDQGLYDAMNKSLTCVSGDFLVFLNAGDTISRKFSWDRFFGAAGGIEVKNNVIIGQTVEKYGNDRYLRPGYGREDLAFHAPPHQATFYPRIFYKSAQYRLDRPIGADGEYTSRAISKCQAIFVPQVVCEFSLGGLSSNYGSRQSLRLRWREVSSLRDAQKLLIKILFWHILPRRLFYRVLANGKYTKIS